MKDILEAYKAGDLSLDDTLTQLGSQQYQQRLLQDLGHSTLDLDRDRRNGAAEVIYGEHKTPAQIIDLTAAMLAAEHNVLITRTTAEVHQALQSIAPDAQFHAEARAITCVMHPAEITTSKIAVVTAGTSDLDVAAEAAVTAEFLGNRVALINDVGVAGIHRLLNRLPEIREARVVIVVAGMEGALPSVVGGLVDKPVIAVPTSVGYGAAFGGVAALLGMLNSCASGVSVVNIDNGFGAGYLANMINRL
jgi:NCAIR mutase (PurE)-related protein